MKIVICVNGRAHEGGVTTYINTIADALRSLGCDVRVVTIFGVSKYREVHRTFKQRTDSLLGGREYLTRLVYTISKVALGLRLLAEFCRSRYDLIYANDVSVVNAVFRWAKLMGLPVVLMVHYPINKDLISQGKVRNGSRVYQYFLEEENRGYKRANKIITPSHYVAQWIRTLQPSCAPIKIIRYPVDTSRFRRVKNRAEVRRRLGFEEEDFIVMFCGRLVNRKGANFPIMALASMEKCNRQGIKLLYVGDGPDGQRLEHMAASLRIRDQVIFQGTVEHRFMLDYYLASDVVVVPSVPYEGFGDNAPNVVFEAMSTGVPVVAFRSGGLAEVIRHEYSGLLVEVRNALGLAGSLLRLKADRQLYSTIVYNAFQQLETVHSPEVVGQATMRYFADGG